jgi:hypothetical protein
LRRLSRSCGEIERGGTEKVPPCQGKYYLFFQAAFLSSAYRRFIPSEILLRAAALMVRLRRGALSVAVALILTLAALCVPDLDGPSSLLICVISSSSLALSASSPFKASSSNLCRSGMMPPSIFCFF